MAIYQNLPTIVLLTFLLSLQSTLSTDPPQNSPSPSPTATPPSSSPPSPNQSPSDDDRNSPSPSPGTAPGTSPVKSPAPGPEKEGDGGEKVKDVKAGGEEREGGMSGGKKAGIALGVIGAACVVGVGGFVYNKRQQNLRRSEFSYGARRDML